MKNKFIKFRCTEIEKNRIENKAVKANITVSEFCRRQALHGKVVSIPKLSPEEISFFQALKYHNSSLARIANLIKYKDPKLFLAI